LALIRYRNQVLSLDSALSLTRGNPVGLMAALSQLNPRRDSFTGVVPASDCDPKLIGQMYYTQGQRSARLSFMAPASAGGSPGIADLLDGLTCQAGDCGAFNLLAEADEHHPIFENLRRSNFFVYAWQRIWRFTPSAQGEKGGSNRWKAASPLDEIALRSLYQALVPPLVQSAEPFIYRPHQGLVYRQNGEVLGFIEGRHGPRGVYLQPVIHPDVEDALGLLVDLIQALPVLYLGRPVYIAVRSYQSWLESALEELHGQAAPRQALFVKHLASAQRVLATNKRMVLEKHQAEPTAPMVNNMVLGIPVITPASKKSGDIVRQVPCCNNYSKTKG
jgi:hypothetical protein